MASRKSLVPHTLPAAATGFPSINLPHGAAPSSPTNGDIWTTTAGLYARVNGNTVGPLGVGSAGPQGPIGQSVIPYGRTGTVTVAAGVTKFRFPFAATILGVSAAVGTAPTGSSLIVDVNKNGTTIFTTQGNRPAIAAGATYAAEVTNMDVTSFAAGDYLTVDIDQIGSTVAGADLVVFVRYQDATGGTLDAVLITGNQTVAGDKTFTGSLIGRPVTTGKGIDHKTVHTTDSSLWTWVITYPDRFEVTSNSSGPYSSLAVKSDGTVVVNADTSVTINSPATTFNGNVDVASTGETVLELSTSGVASTTVNLTPNTAGIGLVQTTNSAPLVLRANQTEGLRVETDGTVTVATKLVTPEYMVIALSDETTAITTGTAKVTMRAPFAMTLTQIPRASLNTASSSGSPAVDINVGGSSILHATNKLSIDSGEKTSTTAGTATSLVTTSIADDAEITFDIDVAGTGAKGLKVTLYYKRA